MKTFEELPVTPALLKGVLEQGYTRPTPIQAQTIPPALLGRDVLGCAQTGTGKTAAFALPILHLLASSGVKAAPREPLALVLAPTRELAIQIGDNFAAYGKHLRLRCGLVYGGVSPQGQIRELARGVPILVATPGRLLDLMDQGCVSLDRLRLFVLDEADRMLDMGFLPDLKRIMRRLPEKRQSLFFSATLPPNIVDLSQRLLRDPVSVNVTPTRTSVDAIQQRVVFVEKRGKLDLLRNLLLRSEVARALVFTRTKRGANQLARKLELAGVSTAAIHGNKSQAARQRALEAFRRRDVLALVATDVAARGIDVDGVTHVINYDMPHEPEAYVHRIGRTGRAGAAGVAVSFCGPDERDDLRAIEKLIGHAIPAARLSSSGSAPPSTVAEPTPGRGKPRKAASRRPKQRNGQRPGEGNANRPRRSGSSTTQSKSASAPSRRERRPRSARAEQPEPAPKGLYSPRPSRTRPATPDAAVAAS